MVAPTGLKVATMPALVALTVLLILSNGFTASVSAQSVTPEQGADFCQVSASGEERELSIGESMHLWIWGVGVAPDEWQLKVGGAGSVALKGAQEIDTEGKLVEWTVVGEKEGRVTFTADMTCEKPGSGTDSLTIEVLPAEPGMAADSPPQPVADFCSAQLSVSGPEVVAGDEFYVWLVGAGTEPHSWNLAMEEDGSANVVQARDLDPQYVEWRLQAAEAGTVRLTGTMNCIHPGDGVSVPEVLVVTREGGIEATTDSWVSRSFQIGAWGRVSIIEAGLMAVLFAVLVALACLVIRRRKRTTTETELPPDKAE